MSWVAPAEVLRMDRYEVTERLIDLFFYVLAIGAVIPLVRLLVNSFRSGREQEDAETELAEIKEKRRVRLPTDRVSLSQLRTLNDLVKLAGGLEGEVDELVGKKFLLEKESLTRREADKLIRTLRAKLARGRSESEAAVAEDAGGSSAEGSSVSA